MSETKPEANVEAPEGSAKTPDTSGQATELSDKDLDEAAGGLWPYVMSSSTYNPTI